MHFILKHAHNNFQNCKLKMSQVPGTENAFYENRQVHDGVEDEGDETEEEKEVGDSTYETEEEPTTETESEEDDNSDNNQPRR